MSSYHCSTPPWQEHRRRDDRAAIAFCRVGGLHAAHVCLLHWPRAVRTDPCGGSTAITDHGFVWAVGLGQDLGLGCRLAAGVARDIEARRRDNATRAPPPAALPALASGL